MNLIGRRFCQILLSTLIIVCTSSCTNNNRGIEKDKEDIKETLVQMWDAIEQEDITKYASYIHPDFTQFGEFDDKLKIGKEIEVNGIKDWVNNSDNIHTEMIDPLVTINGNVAWITYYWSDSGNTGDQSFASKGKSTRIFVRENNKWLCIHGHYTILAD